MWTRKLIGVIAILLVVVCILLSLLFLPFFIAPANQWATHITQIDQLHRLGFDGSGVTIGIIDTGVYHTHFEFENSSFSDWFDVISSQKNPFDDDDHGTHLIGLLASQGSFEGLFSGVNLQGIAPGAKLIVVKAIPRNQCLYGGGNDSTISHGIQFCLEREVDIILLSMGSAPEMVDFFSSNETTLKIRDAVEQGVFVVVAAGNDGVNDDGDVCFPGSLEMVISVGAISKTNVISSFSSKGHQYLDSVDPHKKPELVAPGENILSTRVSGTYGELSGTQQASVYVTGVLALLLEAYPEYRHDGQKNMNLSTILLFKEVLAETAERIGSHQDGSSSYVHDDYYGYGLIQGFDAYEVLGRYYGG